MPSRGIVVPAGTAGRRRRHGGTIAPSVKAALARMFSMHEPPAEVHVAKLDPLQAVVVQCRCGEDDAEQARRYGVETEDHQRRSRRELANGAELRPRRRRPANSRDIPETPSRSA